MTHQCRNISRVRTIMSSYSRGYSGIFIQLEHAEQKYFEFNSILVPPQLELIAVFSCKSGRYNVNCYIIEQCK